MKGQIMNTKKLKEFFHSLIDKYNLTSSVCIKNEKCGNLIGILLLELGFTRADTLCFSYGRYNQKLLDKLFEIGLITNKNLAGKLFKYIYNKYSFLSCPYAYTYSQEVPKAEAHKIINLIPDNIKNVLTNNNVYSLKDFKNGFVI